MTFYHSNGRVVFVNEMSSGTYGVGNKGIIHNQLYQAHRITRKFRHIVDMCRRGGILLIGEIQIFVFNVRSHEM